MIEGRIRQSLAALTVLVATSTVSLAQDASSPRVGTTSDVTNYAPAVPTTPLAQQATTNLTLKAELTEGGEVVTRGLTWRIFGPDAGPDGKLPLIASAQGGSANFELAPGSYLVHAAFGRAGATKRISVGKEQLNDTVVLDAGGLKLGAVFMDGKPINSDKLSFAIYEAAPDTSGDRPLITRDVKPNTVVRLKAGPYHIVSNYGSVNAIVRSDIRVEAGKLTETAVEHNAAEITLKLVREAGGEALADTSWSILTESGDPITEKVGPYASMVLADGLYTVVARNRDHIYQRELSVKGGVNEEVEVLANETTEIDASVGSD